MRALKPGMLLGLLALLVWVLGLGVLHLHLRFNLNDLRREMVALQAQEDRLLNEINTLRGRTEELMQRDRLLALAQGELGLVRCGPDQRDTVRLSAEVTTRYAMARAATAAHEVDEPAKGEDSWLAALGEGLGLAGQAHAADRNRL